MEYFNIPQLDEYEKFVLDGIDDHITKFYENNSKSVLGKMEFIKDKMQKITEEQVLFCGPSINKLQKLYNLEMITHIITQYFDVSFEQLKESKQGKKNIPRLFAIFIAKQYSHSSLFYEN